MVGLLPLRGALQGYAWGLPGRESLAAALHAANTGEAADADLPAAELWLGTHPSGPAVVRATGVPLRDALGADVPFLLKVLSIAKPLSIQAHPDRARAAALHAARPDQYKDANHKPEMAVALTPFEGLCSFRPLAEIAGALERLPALRELVGGAPAAAALSGGASGLRALFATLMRAPAAAVASALAGVSVQLSAAPPRGADADADADALFLRLARFYPGDVGCFAAYLLNHVRASPGEAFFMAANEPHAYLRGQCVEIMATSDNVVRAGLTPKFKDVDTLVDMLTYAPGRPRVFAGEPAPGGGVLYRAAAREFQLVRHDVAPGKSAALPPHTGPGILLVVEGSAALDCAAERAVAKKGFAACLPDGTPATVTAGAEGVVLFRASVNQEV